MRHQSTYMIAVLTAIILVLLFMAVFAPFVVRLSNSIIDIL